MSNKKLRTSKIKTQKILKQNNDNHKYLCFTSSLLIIPIIYFLFNTQYLNEKPKIEFVLVALLILTTIFSQLFWNDPIKDSMIHKIDAIIAKIAIVSFTLYTFVYKFHFSYLFILLAICISFYFSNKYSNKQWCCDEHLYWHGLLHLFCFIGTFYAFSPNLINMANP